MTSMQQEVTVSVEDVNLNELLLTGKTDLNWSIDGKPQEVLELSYELSNTKPERLESFIPQIWEQVQKSRQHTRDVWATSIERYKEMREEEEYQWQTPEKYEGDEQWEEVRRDFVRLNNQGDSITRKTFGRLIADAKQVILPYNPASAVKVYPRTPLPDMTSSTSKIAQAIGFGEIRYDEATVFTEEAVYELMNRISSAFGIGGSEVGELYDNWKQEYYVPPLSTTSSSPQLGWFPNPASVPGVFPPVAAPVVKHEPEFGVVVANKAQVHSSTVNALSSGKFINEGEQLDLSFRQYIVLFHNDDYNRNEAVQLRQQLRDLIPGVDVVMLPMNE